jgi:hypothetical protein
MRRATLPEKLAIAAILLASGCASDHHVSPWGGRTGPSFEPFVPRPDLDGRLAVVDAEAAALGLTRAAELRVELPRKAGAAVIRGYEGRDAAGRPVHAVRVATPLGVVMAVGPLDAGDVDRRQATELVPALHKDGAYRSGTDLAGDGRLAVVLRNDAGTLAIWHVDALGSGPYAVALEAAPVRGIDVDGDGRVDLAGELPVTPDDPIAPHLTDVATFDGGRYSNASPAARAWHAALAAAPAIKAPEEARLRAAIERAWHAVLGGAPGEGALRELRRETVAQALRPSFERHAREIAEIAARR